ncbi:peptidase M4 family protein [Segetibacter sp. 3557_3]|uniref:M4 family metallopeptidase n=1 Tax=Segetibacter sp. 3557_3 TaxID=2547429 RepID=UPI001058987D|nr:M4 family metallopeptidase [Segetibacter sp. 3557_3]TDH18410.1 peptidase M4 family protein [Segetibacter sp. 3557_3]
MKHQHACKGGKCICHVIPPHILENIVKNGNEEQRAKALRTLEIDTALRAERAAQQEQTQEVIQGEAKQTTDNATLQSAAGPCKNRLMHNAENLTLLPGKLVRGEGQASNSDVATDEAYNGFGATFDLFWDQFKRNSIDNKGMDMIATVHYDYSYNNAFWDGKQMVFGDGDGYTFNRFTVAIDIMGHELAHGVTEFTAGLEYHDQPGALNESISDVFGSLVKQRALNQTADQADWIIGAGLLASGRNGVGLRSMKAPGTAYDDWLLGKDPQPDHMSKYDRTTSDNGGVHINSGIPNKAFYLAAIGLGGKAWERAGNIWYQALIDPRLTATAQFQDFADITADVAGKLYDESVQAIIIKAWKSVGINVVVPELPMVPYTVVSNIDGRLQMFVLGTDKVLYHKWQLAPATHNWSGWASLGGKSRQFSVTQHKDGRLEVFTVGLKNGLFYTNWQLAPGTNNWSGWHGLGEAPEPPASTSAIVQQEERFEGSEEVLSNTLELSHN